MCQLNGTSIRGTAATPNKVCKKRGLKQRFERTQVWNILGHEAAGSTKSVTVQGMEWARYSLASMRGGGPHARHGNGLGRKGYV